MGKLIDLSVKLIRKYLPDPFVFAIILTIVAALAAMISTGQSPLDVVENWGGGVWSLLAFSMQMALVLVCGSALADAPLIKRGLRKIAAFPKTPAAAITTVTLVASVACWINWGFGLIVGAIFAKEIARAVKGVDYRLLIASAYSGFVVWHSGLSASIPLAMATEGASLVEVSRGTITSAIPISQTIFATYNLIIVFLIIAALTVVNTLMHPSPEKAFIVDPALLGDAEEIKENNLCGATGEKECKIEWKLTPSEKLNNSILLSGIISVMGLGYLIIRLFVNRGGLDLNSVIMLFMFLGIILHKTPIKYVKAVTNASSSCAGILLQFPFYAGIMGIMTSASAEGVSLAGQISEACVAISNKTTFPMLTFLSAGIVNVFVPSGGGQWAVQAPIMLPAGMQLGVEPAITGMAIAYGDAWTNLIQPFWALPALAIAKLNAKDIMGYCLIDLFVVALIVVLGFLFLV
ncbi:MAG: short-chain fatty acid transporter [Bacteroidales bacterium]|nr:short-chain fatty acid transporter [Bacteroidales bacterium]MBQ8034388.1 short-chain fatty acid transporter [Bacteroidales bacterium]